MSHSHEALPILVFATHNANKVRELQEMLGDRYRIQSLTDIGCHEEIVEDAATLEGNAQIKARHVVTHYGLDCFADDTGLEVNALDGAPGVLSARYAGAHGDSEANMTKLLAELNRVDATSPESRSAQFRTAICLIRDGKEHLIEGTCRGAIALQRSGAKGFGYDPVFTPEGHTRTFADMAPEEKNAISHRGRAVRKMVALLTSP
jgi:XTP/dITP diphosphohydrolase